MINKKELVPGVIVYRPQFKNLNKTVEQIKLMQNQHGILANPDLENIDTSNWHVNQDHIVWKDYFGFGLKEQLELTSKDIKEHYEKYPDNEEILCLKEIDDIYYEIFKDYTKSVVGNENLFYPYLNKEANKDSDLWHVHGFTIYHHKENKNDFEGNPHDLSIIDSPNSAEELNSILFQGWHVDTSITNIDPGPIHVSTINMYFNDDYDGGYILFLYGNNIDEIDDLSNLKIIGYKPKAGDVLAYPSNWPVAHAVLATTKGNRYFSSSIQSFAYDGHLGEDLLKYVKVNKYLYNEEAYTVDKDKIKFITGEDFWSNV